MVLWAATVPPVKGQKDVYAQYRDYRRKKTKKKPAPLPERLPSEKPSWAILLEGIEEDLAS